ncbi:MAG: gliding motility-associated C-terminal domain-containing protein, partial [Cytophagia bacterium]
GSTSVCINSLHNYSVVDAGGRTFLWTITGGTINSGQNTNGVNVTWTATPATIQVRETNNTTTCFTEVSTNITINALPTPTITGSLNVCRNSTQNYSVVNQANTTYIWTVTNGTISTGQNTNQISVIWDNPTAISGTVQIQQTNTLTNCVGTSTSTVTIVPIPAPAVAGNASVCAGSTQNYTATFTTGNTLSWAVVGGTIASGQGTSTLVVNWAIGFVGVSSVALTETNTTTTCSNVFTLPITINSNPIPTLTGSTSVCVNSTQNYSVVNNVGSTYLWTITNGTPTTANTNNVAIVWGNTSTGTIIVRETITATGCFTQITQTITLTPLPNPIITGSLQVCENAVQSYSVPNLPNNTYTWAVTGTGATITSGQNTNAISVTWGTTGVGTVAVTQTNTTTTCVNTITSNVTINPNPTPVITGALQACQGATLPYSVINNAGRTYVWSGGANTTIATGQGTNAVTVTFGTGASGVLTLVETNTATGCATTTFITININANPTNTIVGSLQVCQNATQSYSVTNNVGNTYTWTITGGTPTTATGNSVSIVWGNTTSGTIQVVETITATNCTTTYNANAVLIPIPSTTITGIFNLCADGTATYTAPNPPNLPVGLTYNYNWIITGGTVVSPSTLTSNPITVRWTDNPAGVENIRVTITSVLNGTPTTCTATTPLPSGAGDNGFVTLNSIPNPIITGNTTVCSLTTHTYSTLNLPINSTFIWTVLDGNGTNITATASVTGQGTNSINVTWGNAGIGRIRVQQTTPNTCSKTTLDYNVTIQDVPSTPTSNDRFRCGGAGNITLNATHATATNFNWYNVATGGAVLVNNASYTANITTSPTLFWVSAINTAGCEGPRKQVTVTLDPANSQVITNAVITRADSCVASGDSPSGRILLSLTGNNQNGPYTFVWSKVGEPTFSATTQSLFAITRGTYNVLITDVGGCTTTAGPFIVDETLAQITDGKVNGEVNLNASIAKGTNFALAATATNGVTYEWRDMNNNIVGTTANLLLTPTNIVVDLGNNTGVYTVRITNNRNCFIILTVNIKIVDLQVFVPNVFTPNGDNKNDLMKVYGTGIKSINFKIFNRLGELVFETEDWDRVENQSKGWDGTYKGTLLQDGNYTWAIIGKFIDDTDIKIQGRTTGNVLLMR